MSSHRIAVSPEMLAFVGNGAVDRRDWPEAPISLCFDRVSLGGHLRFDPAAEACTADADLIFIVARAACERIFGAVPDGAATWHLSSPMRALVVEICQSTLPDAWRQTLRLAKSIELLSEVFRELHAGTLVHVDREGALSELDTRRIIAARQLIDRCWHEKLTLDSIARTCGTNRSKLTRGFRALYNCTVADAIAELRLTGARRMLLATDLPVASVGYRCGYLNNASFTRAFSRRFGLAPTQLRACGAAA